MESQSCRPKKTLGKKENKGYHSLRSNVYEDSLGSLPILPKISKKKNKQYLI